MNKLKDSTIKKYNVMQLCKHLNKFQSYHVYPRLYKFNFYLDYIEKKESFSDHYQYYCNIKKYNRELILDCLNDIYKNSNN